MRKIETYNNTTNKYGIYNVNNMSVDGVFPTVEDAKEEIDDLIKFGGVKDGEYEIVEVNHK